MVFNRILKFSILFFALLLRIYQEPYIHIIRILKLYIDKLISSYNTYFVSFVKPVILFS